MTNEAVKVVEVKERTWLESIGSGLVGFIIMVVAGLIVYFGHFIISANLLPAFKICGYIGMLIGAGIVGVALYQTRKVEKEPNTQFTCPFCDASNLFFGYPTKDFVCEACTRTVHFENGQMIPVRTIVCQACRTEHRVPMNILRYVCDRCNRPLKLSADPTQKVAAASNAQNEAMMHNYDVLLIGFDRRHETADRYEDSKHHETVKLPPRCQKRFWASASEKVLFRYPGESLCAKLRRFADSLRSWAQTVSVKPRRRWNTNVLLKAKCITPGLAELFGQCGSSPAEE